MLLLAVFLCAACGLVYELALLTLGDYLAGGGVRATSVVLGVLVASMGLGSLAAKRLLRRPLLAFAVVETALAVVGGLSVLGLYAAYAWLDLYIPAVLFASVLIGALIGAEVPLLMALLQQIRAQDAGEAVADLNAADYLGALRGRPRLSVPAPARLRPATRGPGRRRGQSARRALVVGWLRTADDGTGLPRRTTAVLAVLATTGVLTLTAAAVLASDFEVTASQRLYRAPITSAERSRYQEIVVTRSLPGAPDGPAPVSRRRSPVLQPATSTGITRPSCSRRWPLAPRRFSSSAAGTVWRCAKCCARPFTGLSKSSLTQRSFDLPERTPNCARSTATACATPG